jgi:bacteriorhodopsin
MGIMVLHLITLLKSSPFNYLLFIIDATYVILTLLFLLTISHKKTNILDDQIHLTIDQLIDQKLKKFTDIA